MPARRLHAAGEEVAVSREEPGEGLLAQRHAVGARLFEISALNDGFRALKTVLKGCLKGA